MDFWYPLSPFRAIIHININNSHNPMGISLDWRHALIIHWLNLLSSINAFFFCGPRTVFTTQHVRMKTERNTNLFKTKNKKWGEHTVGLCFVLALFFDLWSLSRVKLSPLCWFASLAECFTERCCAFFNTCNKANSQGCLMMSPIETTISDRWGNTSTQTRHRLSQNNV